MIDEKLYRETFSRLRASDEAKQEVIMHITNRSETKIRRPLRALRAAAVAAMLTVALAVSANAASNGVLFENLRVVWQTDSQMMLEDDQGNQVMVTGVCADAEIRDGKLMLTVDGSEYDITADIQDTGAYSATVEAADGRAVDVTVTGTLEDYSIQTSVADGGVDYQTAVEGGAEITKSFVTVTGE